MRSNHASALSFLLGGILIGAAGCGAISDEASFVGDPSSAGSDASPPPQAGLLTAGVWDDNLNYDVFEGYLAETSTLAGIIDLASDERRDARAHFETRAPKQRVDIAFVLDTTGSMHDELDYLRAEFAGLAERLAEDHPNADHRFALVAYGDEGDDYVTDVTDFTDAPERFSRTLRDQGTTSGGDYPEAPDRGLEDALQLDWRSGATARIIYWIADAPHHRGDERRLEKAVRDARGADIHIYPIAASGADALTEHTMRSAAQFTGGRYLFLTDDSGIGGPHREPAVPCFFVTSLENAILRTVDIELTGVYREPAPQEILRTGGDPTDGHCTLGGGQTVAVF